MRTLLLLLLFPLTSFAHESDEVLKLKAANDALTMRVAELLEENERLEKFVREALVAQSTNEPIVLGCDPQDLRREVLEEAWKAMSWLKSNGEDCTTEQLQYIIRNIHKWSDYHMGQPRKLAEYYRDQR